MRKNADLKTVLTRAIDCGIITLDDVMDSDKEDIMATILDTVHCYAITKSGDRYITYVKDMTKPNGRRQVRKKSKTDLFNYLIDFYGVSNQKEITFAELFDEWLDYKKKFLNVKNRTVSISSGTLRKAWRDFNNYLRDSELANMPIRKITSTKFELTLIDIINKRKLKEKCVRNIMSNINQMMEYALRAEYVEKNFMVHIDRNLMVTNCETTEAKPDEERILTTAQLWLLRKSILMHETKYPYYMPDYAIELAILTGMRAGELSALRWSDIDDNNINIRYSEHRWQLDGVDQKAEYFVGRTKTKKSRCFPITADIQTVLDKIKALGLKSDDDFIFIRKDGSRYTEHDIGCACNRRGNEAGIPNVNLHRIRRTVSSELNAITDLSRKDVASMIGHSERINARHYDYATAEYKQKVNALERVSSMIINYPNNKEYKEKAE